MSETDALRKLIHDSLTTALREEIQQVVHSVERDALDAFRHRIRGLMDMTIEKMLSTFTTTSEINRDMVGNEIVLTVRMDAQDIVDRIRGGRG
jgi:hypothetical protein